MMAVARGCAHPISQVIVYKGHEKNPSFGPYHEGIAKRIAMFNELNRYREADQKQPWNVTSVAGEELAETLKNNHPEETLLVIPAGQTTNLEKVFTSDQIAYLKEFFSKGGRGYFNCGSAYWVSSKRVYKDLSQEHPEHREPMVKTSTFPLFEGTCEGPLCPFPGRKYKVGFYSDAVKVTDNKNECAVYLSGGGSFLPSENLESTQKIRVLVRYVHSELLRHGKKEEECRKWENAAIMVSVGKGAALLSAFHPYYGSSDFDVEAYERTFPDCGTNWKEVREKLSSLDTRMKFVFHSMLSKLESMDFDDLDFATF